MTFYWNVILRLHLYEWNHVVSTMYMCECTICTMSGLDINVCPVPVKTDVRQVDLVLRLSDGTSEINSYAKSAWYARRQHSYNICKDFLSHNSWMKNLNFTNSCTINKDTDQVYVRKISWFILVISDGVLQWKPISVRPSVRFTCHALT
jgi:hypothetical protein